MGSPPHGQSPQKKQIPYMKENEAWASPDSGTCPAQARIEKVPGRPVADQLPEASIRPWTAWTENQTELQTMAPLCGAPQQSG